MRPSPDEPPPRSWVPICRWCWVGLHDRCLGGVALCECLCPHFWNPPEEAP